MWKFGFGSKIDSTIKPYLNINSKRKIPVIVCYKDNLKLVKNKILYNSGKVKHEYDNVNAVACELSPLSIDKISDIPEVSYILFDHKASLCLKKSHSIMEINHSRVFNLTGKGIGIGIVDTGVYPHPDLTFVRNTISYFQDLVNSFEKPYDDNGHGTFMCGLIASSGHVSGGIYQGMAPDSNLCVIKAFDASGKGFLSDIIKSIDVLISLKDKYNIKVIVLPFEFPYINKFKVNPLEEIVKKAVAENISVVVPSGNLGPQPYSIYFPGNMKQVITVGGVICKDNKLKEYKVASFSGRGPSIDGTVKPDLIAPCMNVTSLASNTLYLPATRSKPELTVSYTTMSGTSISCALIAGVLSLILEKTPNLTPQDLKSILCLSTLSIGENKFSQGSGIFVFDKIVK
jgi:serine protease AprX